MNLSKIFKVVKSRTRVIFCYNQIALTIAYNLAKADTLKFKHTIFYAKDRCDIEAFKDYQITAVEYKFIHFINFFIKSFFVKPYEVCIPHFRGGKVINYYAKYAKKLSLIDDGLDTFRDVPKNIDLSQISPGTDYYSFNYNFDLGIWLHTLNFISVCDVTQIEKSSKKSIDLNSYGVVIVESPGVENLLSLIGFEFSNALYIKHPNPLKNIQINCPSVIGNEIAIEKSLAKYTGRLIVGESMVLIYCLLNPNEISKISPCFSDISNMNALKRLIETTIGSEV